MYHEQVHPRLGPAPLLSLGGVAGAAEFEGALRAAFASTRERDEPLSVVFVAVDDYVSFGERYGPAEQSRALSDVARLLREVAGYGALVAHGGREQFALLLPDAYLDRALEVAERACARMAELTLVHEGSQRGRLTLSAGVATTPTDADGVDDLLDTADRAVRRARTLGGNRIAGRRYGPREPSTIPSAGSPTLPATLTRFIGREPELTALIERLRGSRLVTLVGPGGVGKTRIAIEAARRAQATFPDGVWFADLTATTDESGVVPLVAALFTLQEMPTRPLLSMLLEELRPKGALLVLDNCEHVIAACADLVDAVVRAAPHVAILCTTREPLAIIGEALVRVEPFEVPARDDLPAGEAATFTAIQLFAERAAGVTHFVLDDEVTPYVTRICRSVDGLALGIELAAVSLRAMDIFELDRAMERRIELATGRRRAGRHDSLRGVLEWSLASLGPAEVRVFRRLAVFVGGWTLEHAEQVCAEGALDVRGSIARLVDASLVSLVPRGTRRRYHILETTLDYARELLVESGELEALRRRHAETMLAFAQETERHFQTMPTRTWIDWISADEANVGAALDWAVTNGQDLRLGAALCAAWYVAAQHTARLLEFRRTLARVREGVPELDAPTAARFALASGINAVRVGDLPRALADEERAVELFASLGDDWGRCKSTLHLAEVLIELREFDRAEALLEETSRELQARADAPLLIAGAAYDLSCIRMMHRSDPAGAQRLLQEAAEITRASGHDRLLGACLAALAIVAFNAGDFARAVASSTEAIAIYERIGTVDLVAFESINVGEYLRRNGNLGEARAAFARALRRYLIVDHKRAIASCLESLARVAIDTGNSDVAVRLAAFSDGWNRDTVPRQPVSQESYDAMLARARAELGEERYQAVRAAAARCTLDEAVALALAFEV